MPQLKNSQGETFDVSDADAARMSAADPSLSIVGDVATSVGGPEKAAVARSAEDTQTLSGVTPITPQQQTAHAHRGYLADKTSILGTTVRGLASGISFGLSDKLADPETIEADQTINPNLRTGTELVGAFAPALFGDEAGVASALEHPLEAERAASSLSSNLLYGGRVAGDAELDAKVLEKGLMRGKGALDDAKAFPAELAGMDAKGLRAAGDAEVAAIKEGRIPAQKQLVEDLGAHRQALKDEKIWLATQGADAKAIGEVSEIGKVSFDADKSIRRILNNPDALAEKPWKALEPLQQQATQMRRLAAHETELRTLFAADETGTRVASLDALPGALQRNEKLQATIRELTSAPASDRLAMIEDAKAALSKPAPAAPPASMAEQALSGTAFGAITGAAHSIPVLGQIPGVAHFIGAKGSKLITDVVFGRMAKATAGAAAHTSSAVSSFLSTAARGAPFAAPVIASKVLNSVRFAPAGAGELEPAAALALPAAYKARAAELRSQTAYNPLTGVAEMRPEARAAMASRLAPIRAVSPKAADMMETIAARRIEFLASKLPRRPDLGGMPLGPDHWQPSDMEMRAFARYVAAVEDPGAVEHRVAAGTITPEDAEAYHAVYPERAADFKRQILEQAPSLTKALPYQRRVALSIFAGVAIDPAMNPNVLAVLQGSFAAEPGSEGGMQGPKAAPQFGSVKKSVPQPTPSESRAQGHQGATS